MKKTEKLTFIEGNYSNEGAKEILMEILSSKINFHKIENYSSRERLGKEDELALKRIKELKMGAEKLLLLVSEAKVQQKQLIISSEINISLADY